VSQEKTPEVADVEAERAVLGAVITLSVAENAREAVESTGPLPPEAFTAERRHVWEAICSLVADGRAVDGLTLSERLKARGKFVEVGGHAALMAYDQGVPLTHNLPSYVAILRDRMQRREGLAALEQARTQFLDLGKNTESAALAASNRLASIKGHRPLRRAGQLVYAMLDKWEANIEAQRTGATTATPMLPYPHDALAGKGPLRGKLNVIAGRSGNFKTGLVSDAIWHWGHTLRETGGVLGLEDGCSWFLERLTAREVGIAYEQIGYARLDEEHKGQHTALQNWCVKAHETLEKHVFIEDDTSMSAGSALVTFRDVYATLQRWADNGARWAVLDHGLCVDWLPGSGVDRPDLAIGRGMRMLSRLAERTGMAIVVLWHLNRAQEEGTFPKRADLKESGYLDAEARRIDVLWRQPTRPGFQLCTAVKATKGQEGVTGALPLYDAPYGLLGNRGGYVVDFESEEAERRARAEAEKTNRPTRGGKSRLFDGGA